MKTCPNCSRKIQDKETICPYCGKTISLTLIDRFKTNLKLRIGLITGIILVVAIIGGGISLALLNGLFGHSCYEQSQAYLTDFTPLFGQWNESIQKIQGLNKREIELVEISLEATRDQVSQLTPPRCAQHAHTLILSYMDDTLNGYNAFISAAPEGTVKSYFEDAANHYSQYRTLILKTFPELSEPATSTP